MSIQIRELRTSFLIITLTAAVSILSLSYLNAQDSVIKGKVLDHEDRAVAGAHVLVCDQETGIPLHVKTLESFTESMGKGKQDSEGMTLLYTTTDEQGCFALPKLPVGEYRLVCQSWKDADPIEGILEVNGKIIELHGTVDQIRIPYETPEEIVIRPLGRGRAILDCDFPNDETLLVLSLSPTCADPILGFSGWFGDFLTKGIGCNRMPRGYTEVRGLPEGKVYLAVFAADNNPGFGDCSMEVSGTAALRPSISVVASWSDARHTPPERLQPLFDEFKDKPDELTRIIMEQEEFAGAQGLDRAWPALDLVTRSIPLADDRTETFGDLLAVLSYIKLQMHLDKQKREYEERKRTLEQAEASGSFTSSDWGTLAWKRTDGYTPPDYDSFFPDDPEGGRLLDAYYYSMKADKRSDDEILEVVRNGMMHTTQHQTLILSYIGNRYVWGKNPQHPRALEIMFHAADPNSGTSGDRRHYAVYFGLSVVNPPKPPAVLRALVEVALAGHDHRRILWGCRTELDALLKTVEPFLTDDDPVISEAAATFEVKIREKKSDRND